MTSIMIVGVGGQGTLLASRIIGHLLVDMGYDVKVSEVHGMSQRGGSVVTYVKYGDKINSPVVDTASADFVLAFEELEAYRCLPYLKKDGMLIVNTQNMNPMPVITGKAEYPQEIIRKIEEQNVNVLPVDALKLAEQSGNVKAVNVVLIGKLAKRMDIAKEKWLDAIKKCVPAKFLEVNLKAFEEGYGE